MRQLAQNYKDGTLSLVEAPAPLASSGGVIVRNAFSLISTGTETMKVREGGMSLLGKAKARPDQVEQVIQSVRQVGIKATYQKVMSRLDKFTPLGYSSAGFVTEVGAGISGVSAGHRVACGGAEYANHAEYVFVPRNLFARIPEGVSLEHAAFSTVGAIAMQGVRQADVRVGENVAVIGLGLLGQLITQILLAAGCRVIGMDLSPSRCLLAQQRGAWATTDHADFMETAGQVSRNRGVDRVILAAGSLPPAVFSLAGEMCRDRGTVVAVGMNKLELPWKIFYEKEIDVRYSRSYGPGRYDPQYEAQGVDYPIGYVRWTENRNMEGFLDLLASGKVDLSPLITGVYPFSDAEKVYREMVEKPGDYLAVLFQYPEAPAESRAILELRTPTIQGRSNPGIGCIGAGNYARSMLLPVLQKSPDIELRSVVTRTPLNAVDAGRKFGFERAGTDAGDILRDPSIAAVLIATRHDSHARYVIEALKAGKHVFVEKPLTIRASETRDVVRALKETGKGLQVGFNRRFSPVLSEMKALLGAGNEPLAMHYRVHAGKPTGSSWFFEEGQGGRFVGEAGHFIDVMAFLTDSVPQSVFARSLGDGSNGFQDILATFHFADGSVGTLAYVSNGSNRTPKEYLEVFGRGSTAILDNFREAVVHKGNKTIRLKGKNDKGQSGELQAFVRMIRDGGSPPIPYDQLIGVTQATIAVIESLKRGTEVRLDDELFLLQEPAPMDQQPSSDDGAGRDRIPVA